MTSTTGPTDPRRGFTLVEILTVLGIFAVVAGIAWAGILGTRRSAGLTGGAEMIAGFARQARATALSTGAPVQIVLDQQNRSVAGVSQTPVFDLGFDSTAESYQKTGDNPGFAGRGWTIAHTAFPADPAGDTTEVDSMAIEWRATHPLMRKDGDGFYLSCWVQPPPILDGPTPGVLPLLLIGHGTAGDRYHDDSAPAMVGLALELEPLTLQQDTATISLQHWTPTAWICPQGGGMTDAKVVYGVTPLGAPHPTVASLGSLNVPVSAPILGGDWIELGLLYDGQDLFLLRSGVVVATEEDVAFPVPDLDGPGGRMHLFFGRMTDGGSARGAGLIDEIRVVRIGSDRPQRLPAGVDLARDYRITCGGGEVRFEQRAAPTDPWDAPPSGDPQEIVLRSSTTDARAVVTIGADGSAAIRYEGNQ